MGFDINGDSPLLIHSIVKVSLFINRVIFVQLEKIVMQDQNSTTGFDMNGDSPDSVGNQWRTFWPSVSSCELRQTPSCILGILRTAY